MNFIPIETFEYYKLGNLVAYEMLNGIVHPDMQLSNIGRRRNGQPAFIDYADIIQIDIPKCLSADICEQLTLSLVPIIEELKSSFSNISSFRMGFITLGGLLGHTIFLNALNLGISSSWYTKYNFSVSSYDPSFLYSDVKNKTLIKNWKKQPLNQITPEKYPIHDEYERSKERFRILDENCYYLDILYYIRSYMQKSCILDVNLSNKSNSNQVYSNLDFTLSVIMSNCSLYIEKIAESALHFKHYYTAYGLFNKCLSSTHKDGENKNKMAAQNGLSAISQSTHINSSVCDFVMETSNLNLFEFMWILDDLDHNRTLSF